MGTLLCAHQPPKIRREAADCLAAQFVALRPRHKAAYQRATLFIAVRPRRERPHKRGESWTFGKSHEADFLHDESESDKLSGQINCKAS